MHEGLQVAKNPRSNSKLIKVFILIDFLKEILKNYLVKVKKVLFLRISAHDENREILGYE